MKIYCIVDDNGLKYVGKTSRTLNCRLNEHRSQKNTNHVCCSSFQLDLDNCKIYLIQECSEEDCAEREMFWIKGLTCVNIITEIYGLTKKEYDKKYRIKNKERCRENDKRKVENNQEHYKKVKRDWYQNNKERILKKQRKEYYLKIKLKK